MRASEGSCIDSGNGRGGRDGEEGFAQTPDAMALMSIRKI